MPPSIDQDRPRHLAEVLERPGSTLAALRAETGRLASAERALRECVGEVAAAHLRVVRIDERRALVHADSSAFATRGRWLGPRIAAALRRRLDLPTLERVEFSVRPPPDDPTSATRRRGPRPLSRQTRTLLEGVAASVEHAGLRRVLERLARRGE